MLSVELLAMTRPDARVNSRETIRIDCESHYRSRSLSWRVHRHEALQGSCEVSLLFRDSPSGLRGKRLVLMAAHSTRMKTFNYKRKIPP